MNVRDPISLRIMSDLSPKLLERRRLRETRYRPWKDVQPISSTITLRRSTLDNPITTYSRIPRLIRRSNPLLICAKLKPIRAKFRPSGSFPFLRLPVEIQVLVGEYVVQYQTPIKCKGRYSPDET